MKYARLLIVMTVASLTGCGAGSGSANAGRLGKMEGPNVKSLSHDQLMAVYHECTQYGQIDDPNVKYTVRYCAAIQSAHLSEGYAAPGTPNVDPTLNRMH